MIVPQINGKYSLLKKMACFSIFFCVLSSSFAWAATHTAILKITNPNATASATPVFNSDGAEWTQVYIEIPAGLYIKKGWLDDDLKNLRFIDVDSGGIELTHWRRHTDDDNVRINHLGFWLLVKDLDPGETETIRIEMVDPGNLIYANPRAPLAMQTTDKTHDNAASTVFPFYARDPDDSEWNKSSSDAQGSNVEFIDNKLHSEDDLTVDQMLGAAAVTGNEFTLNIHDLKFNKTGTSRKLIIYFLSQAGVNVPAELDQKDGYRLLFDGYTDISDDFHYDQVQYAIKLQNRVSNSWLTVAQTVWEPYSNTRCIVDIKVSNSRISLLINGLQHDFTGANVDAGQYKRVADPLTKGHVGFHRINWVKKTRDIHYFTLRRFLDEEPSYEVYGNADLVIKDTSSSPNEELGEDVVEIAADLQQMRKMVGGNTLEDYIFATYSIARTEQIIDSYEVTLKNRSTSGAETFTWNIQNSEPDKWKVYYCDDKGSNCSLTEPLSTTLQAISSETYTIKFIPTISALVNGSTARLSLSIEGDGDGSFDNVSLTATTFGNLGCFWEYKDKHVVEWPGGNGYDDLADYQVYLNISNEPLLQNALVDGSDIIITDDHSNVLDFWLKSYDRTTNSLEAWVKVPNLTGSSGDVELYVWWGNKNYLTSRSNRLKTFDLFEDWESDYAVTDKVGCDDGTRKTNVQGTKATNATLQSSSCEGAAIDPHGWENIPTPDDYYNWWEVDSIGGGSKVMQADVSSSHTSDDKGPWVHHGGLGWDHYEVSYTFYTGEYHQYDVGKTYDGEYGNPQYNPVFFNDAGNMWGMEYFRDKFIFRPYAAGIDYVWQYQTYAKGLLGGISFPKKNSWYSAKVTVLKNKEAVDPTKRKSYLKVYMSQPQTSPTLLPDVDSVNSTDYTLIADFTAPPTFNLDYGGIAFGGWDSGFAFDDIRVRKYVEDATGIEPVVKNPDNVIQNDIRPELMLASPTVTAPIFNGRPAYIEISATPFAWRGDFFAYYADCYINGECANDKCSVCGGGGTETCPGVAITDCEDQSKIGTFSIFGKIDDTTAKGAGYYLMERDPGENNPTIPLTVPPSSNRTMYTTNGITTNFINFEINECSNLQSDLGTIGNCVDETTLPDGTPSLIPANYDETEKLIRFVRGYYVADPAFSRSGSRNFDATSNYGNNDTIPDPSEQWKIADALHSNPLMIGIPNMTYGYKDYWEDFVDTHDKRALYSYFMTNDGLLHAIQLSSVGDHGYYVPDTEATEKWAFIPNAVLSKLTNTIDAEHEYVADGLLRAIDAKIDDNNPSSPDQWRTILFGLGGRENTYVFAMDVTDPEMPKLLWEMDADSAGKIGTTISAPAMGKIDSNGDGDLDKWVAIVGSGYDLDYLANYESSTAWLTVIDLADGTILKQIQVSDKKGNVLTDLAVLRDAKTGGIDKLYFGDYYGCLWRLDEENDGRLGASSPAVLNDICNVGDVCDLLYKPEDYGTALLPDEPKYPITAQPRIGKGELKEEFWVYVGTGDYNEFEVDYPNQKFLGLKDRDTASEPYILSDLADMTVTTATNQAQKSWVIGLGVSDDADVINGTQTGETSVKDNNERVIKIAEVYGGFVFFTTFQPINEPCGGGKSRFYAAEYRSGELKSGLFLNLKDSNGDAYKDVRSVELETGGVPSQPMIMEGESGKGTAVATGVTTSSSGGIEKVELDPGSFSTALDILLWREKR